MRLQRQAIEEKLKEDKENKVKREEEAKAQNDENLKNGLVVRNPLTGNGGSNKLRDQEVQNISNTVNYILNQLPGEVVMVPRSWWPR